MSAIKYASAIDLSKCELQNARVQNLSSAPSSPVLGQIYYDTALVALGTWNGSSWDYVGAVGVNDVTKAANATAANVLQVSAGLNKALQDFTSAGGIIKVSTTGVVSIAVAGTDYLTGSSTNALTNKSFDANGTGNSITNLETADFAANVIDTDGTLAANSDTRIPSQKAVRTFVAASVASLAKPMGGIDCSANPNYPAANAGEFYRVTVAGKIGGASGPNVEVGDEIHCFTTSIAGTHAAVGANWTIVQSNVDQATSTTLGLVALATQAETEAKVVTTKAVVPADLVNFPTKKTATIGDGSTANLVVTDNLNTKDKIAVCRDATTDDQIMVDITYGTNTTTFKFDSAPAINAYKVVIIG